MATVAQVRILLGDIARYERQAATGDGVSVEFALTKFPVITDTETITVNGSAATYTLDVETGLVTFDTAPTDGHPIAATYNYAEISDESIAAILALEPDAYSAAALAADSIAGKYASSVDKKIGDLSISNSQRAKQWSDKAKAIRAAGRSGLFTPHAGGISVADKQTYTGNPDIVQPAFTRTLHDNDGAAPDYGIN